MLKTLTDTIQVTGQIWPDDLATLASAGVKTIINNRPDNEMPGQPLADDMMKAAQEAGIAYHFLPMAGGLTQDLLERSASVYETAKTPMVIHCASGMRSVVLWCFANVKSLGTQSVLETASKAGYELPQIRQALDNY